MSETCRICFEECDTSCAPCKCAGSIKYVHRACIDAWRESDEVNRGRCGTCQSEWNDWEYRDVVESEPEVEAKWITALRAFSQICSVDYGITNVFGRTVGNVALIVMCLALALGAWFEYVPSERDRKVWKWVRTAADLACFYNLATEIMSPTMLVAVSTCVVGSLTLVSLRNQR